MDRFPHTASLMLLFLCIATTTFGQMNTADLTGRVTDPTGAVIPGATVTVLQVATQQKRTATSNDDGEYVLTHVSLGEYRLTIDAQGFTQAIREGVLHVGDHIRQDFSLRLQDTSQSVMVEASSGLAQVESAEESK